MDDDQTPSPPGESLSGEPMIVYRFDGKGDVAVVATEKADAPATGKGFLAVVGNSGAPVFQTWLKHHLGGPQAETMTAPGAQARCTVVDDRATLVLRIARREADPDDIRRHPIALWVEKGRIIISTPMQVPELIGIEQWRQSRHAPVSPADFVARMGLRAADRLEPLVEHVGNVLDDLEEEIIEGRMPELSLRLNRTRRTVIALRRMIWPQRDVLNTLEIEELSFFTEWDRARLREATARTSRLGDELQSLSERAALVHEQTLDGRAEQMNRTMLVLASVAVIGMPMTVISGLLGMNVAGISFAQNAGMFWFVVVGLAVLGAGMAWFMRARKWL